MSEQMFSQLKHLIGHLPKSKLLAGAALSDGKFKFYLSGKKQGRINEAISNKDAVIMGDGGVANIAYAEGVYSYSSHNFGFFSEKESVETQYIYRALENFLPVIDYKGFVGSGIKNIDKNFLFDLYLQIPPLPEQKKITSILTSVDEVIENTQKQIDKLQDLKKATMNELLTKGIGHTEFKDSELGRIPKSWEVRTIGESCDIKNTLRLPISREEREKIRGNYRYYGPTGILDYINEYRLEGEYTLIGEDGDHFIKFYEKPQSIYVTGKFNVNNHAHILEGNAVVSARWVYWFFLHRDIGPALTRQGAGRYKLNKDSLQKLEISIPPMMEQVEIDVKLKCFDTLIRSKTKKLSQTQSLKKSLMQDLLTGKVRVTVN